MEVDIHAPLFYPNKLILLIGANKLAPIQKINIIIAMLELSIYTLQFCNKSHYYVYNSRSNFFSEISKELYDAFKSQNWDSLPDFVIEELKSKELICESNSKFDFYYSQLISFNARNNDRTTLNLVLAPTTACNFACPYCFESKRTLKQ